MLNVELSLLRGLLKVAEVSSRFEDVRGFLGAVSKLGFKVISKVRGLRGLTPLVSSVIPSSRRPWAQGRRVLPGDTLHGGALGSFPSTARAVVGGFLGIRGQDLEFIVSSLPPRT